MRAVSNVKPVAGSTDTALPERPPYPQAWAIRTEPEAFGATEGVASTNSWRGVSGALAEAMRLPSDARKWRTALQARSVVFCTSSTVAWVPVLLKRGTVYVVSKKRAR